MSPFHSTRKFILATAIAATMVFGFSAVAEAEELANTEVRSQPLENSTESDRPELGTDLFPAPLANTAESDSRDVEPASSPSVQPLANTTVRSQPLANSAESDRPELGTDLFPAPLANTAESDSRDVELTSSPILEFGPVDVDIPFAYFW